MSCLIDADGETDAAAASLRVSAADAASMAGRDALTGEVDVERNVGEIGRKVGEIGRKLGDTDRKLGETDRMPLLVSLNWPIVANLSRDSDTLEVSGLNS